MNKHWLLAAGFSLVFVSCAGSRGKTSDGKTLEGEQPALAGGGPAEGCTLKAEPSKVKPGQTFTLSWNTISKDAALFAHHQPGTVVPSAGTRILFFNEPGEYVYGVGTAGTKGGYMPNCSAKVVVTAQPKGRSKLAVLKQEQKSGLTELQLMVQAEPGSGGCKGNHTLGFGDGNFQTLPELKDCKQRWSGTQVLVSGTVTATLYRGSMSDAASGKAKVLAELPISISAPPPEKK